MASTIQDQISKLPLDDFPEQIGQTGQAPKPVIQYPKYTKQFWLDNFGAGKGFRSWHNPTRDVQRLEMYLAIPKHVDPATVKETERMCVVEIPPDGTVELPKIWDRAILVVKDGQVIGGMAPRLRPVGTTLDLGPGLAHLDGDPFAGGV
jgi:hypothetical protein